MSGYSSKIAGAALSGLAAHEALLAATANNLANANTPGYVRRSLTVEPRQVSGRSAGLSIGNGVQIGTLQRQVDQYLERLVRGAAGQRASADIRNDFMSRAESFFSLEDGQRTIGTALNSFFAAVDDLAADPASIELRTSMIERGNDLVTTLRDTYNGLADLQREADDRVSTEVASVNSLLTQIAALNGTIVTTEGQGNVAADERDTRDQLIRQLSDKISFTVTENSETGATLSLENGFVLVTGTTARELTVTKAPSFASGGLPPSLGGGVLSYIVFDYGASGASNQVDLTSVIAGGEGNIAGLLSSRGVATPSHTNSFQAGGPIVEAAARVEAITRQLLTAVNQTYLGADEDSGTTAWEPSSGDLDGNSPGVYGLFSFTFSGSRDADSDGRPDDLTALNVDNFSSILTFNISDPRRIAAARDLQAATASLRSFAPGDGSNLTALSALQTTSATFSAGGFSQAGTFEQIYNQIVGFVGNAGREAETDYNVADSSLISAENRRDSVSAVSTDEELVDLTRFQKGYQASARVFKSYQEIFDILAGLL